MEFNKELYYKLILYIGSMDIETPYYPIDEVVIPGYTKQDIYNHLALMIEGEMIDGFFAEDEDSPHFGYMIGGLTTETKYLYQLLQQGNE